MSPHLSEENLIAYQLGETPEPAAMAAHLEQCVLCAAAAESIAETLRVFSADPVPAANLDHAWQRLRSALPPLAAKSNRSQSRRWFARWPLLWTSGFALAAGLLGVAVLHLPHKTRIQHLAALQPGPLTSYPQARSVTAHQQCRTPPHRNRPHLRAARPGHPRARRRASAHQRPLRAARAAGRRHRPGLGARAARPHPHLRRTPAPQPAETLESPPRNEHQRPLARPPHPPAK